MEVAIVDDEKVIREQIKKLTVKYEPDCNVIAYETGEELLAEGKKLDVVFLDIQMEGMNGIDTARALREKQEDMVVIFITGVKEYVFEAFDVSAFHYLLKPVEEKKFSEVFERAKKEVEKRNTRGQKSLFIKTRNRSFTINHFQYQRCAKKYMGDIDIVLSDTGNKKRFNLTIMVSLPFLRVARMRCLNRQRKNFCVKTVY